jgi:hypothetical protein
MNTHPDCIQFSKNKQTQSTGQTTLFFLLKYAKLNKGELFEILEMALERPVMPTQQKEDQLA